MALLGTPSKRDCMVAARIGEGNWGERGMCMGATRRFVFSQGTMSIELRRGGGTQERLLR